ncbi:DWNN domain-containing protein [Zychaea mexicana]|uniref:DWNN domain-containing protein n=1 Tax=Zychaea mexicana TaxID=64656 RepID=UPI0022FEEBE3|nr:DWNN domain-containing protein [Zychaea mexicana]KAI9498137.1 DWNN domain-containing protein [Zychaea mexicana]
MSVIYYKFKAAKDSDYDVYTFDGPGATVFDVKREILRAKKLGKGTDFDLAIYNAQTDEEYKDDVFVVPRNTSIIVRRLPASRPGKGTAQRYVSGALPADGKGMGSSGMGMLKGPPGPAAERFGSGGGAGGRNMVLNAPQYRHRQQQQQQQHQQQQQQFEETVDAQPQGPAPTDDSEEARIQAMFQQTTDQWGAMQEKLAEQQYIPFTPRGGDWRRGRGGYHHSQRGGHGGGSGGNGENNGDNNQQQQPQRVPPPTYVCYRCGQKGHYINQCPTNGDKEFDKHPRIKRTTGIPRSFLKVIEEPKNAVKSGTGGLMVTPKGDLVVAQADSSTWDKHVAKSAATINLGTATAGDLLELFEEIPIPAHLQCPICEGPFREATITPCCGASFCDECIRGYLLENDFACQDCQQQIPNGLDGLIPNMDVRASVDSYVREYVRNHRE